MQVWTSEQNIKSIVSSKFFEECKSENCKNADCKKKHDLDTERRLHNLLKRKKCRFGVKCKSPLCRFQHPAGYLPISGRECHHGLNCHNKKCGYRHPVGERKTKTELPCRFGAECYKLDCGFAHPPARKEKLQALIHRARKKRRIQDDPIPNVMQPPSSSLIRPNFFQHVHSTMHPYPSPYADPSYQYPPSVIPENSYESRLNLNAQRSGRMETFSVRHEFSSQHHQDSSPRLMHETIQKTSLQSTRSVDNSFPQEVRRNRKRRRPEIEYTGKCSIMTSRYRKRLDERRQRRRDQISYAHYSPNRKDDSHDEMLHVPAIHGMGLEEAYDFPPPDGVPAETLLKHEPRESVWPEVHTTHQILHEIPPLEIDD